MYLYKKKCGVFFYLVDCAVITCLIISRANFHFMVLKDSSVWQYQELKSLIPYISIIKFRHIYHMHTHKPDAPDSNNKIQRSKSIFMQHTYLCRYVCAVFIFNWFGWFDIATDANTLLSLLIQQQSPIITVYRQSNW